MKKPEDFTPVPSYPDGHRHAGKPRCQAWSASKGRQCMALPYKKHGLDKCKVHGGESLKGIASATLKTGEHSEYLTTDLRKKYEQRINSPDLLKLDGSIALIDTRIFEQLESLADGGGSAVFASLQKEFNAFEKANNKARAYPEDSDKRIEYLQKARDHLTEVRKLVNFGASQAAIWDDIFNLIERKRRVVDTDQKIKTNMKLLINVEDVAFQIEMLLKSIRKNVTDPTALRAIQSDYAQLTHRAS